jgi:hypothetical protein
VLAASWWLESFALAVGCLQVGVFGAAGCWQAVRCSFFYIGWWNAGIFYAGCSLLAGCTLELGTGYLLDFLVQELGTICRNFLFSWLELV